MDYFEGPHLVSQNDRRVTFFMNRRHEYVWHRQMCIAFVVCIRKHFQNKYQAWSTPTYSVCVQSAYTVRRQIAYNVLCQQLLGVSSQCQLECVLDIGWLHL
jgi:hypothetical protein